LGKKKVGGLLFTSRNRLENVLKSDLLSPFQQYLLNGKEFFDAAWMFWKVLIRNFNLNTNFVFFSKELEGYIVIWICPNQILEMRIPIMCRWRGVKMEV